MPRVDFDIAQGELRRCPGDELVQALDETAYVVGLAAGRVTHVGPTLEGDYVETFVQPAGLARRRHPGGVAADHVEPRPPCTHVLR